MNREIKFRVWDKASKTFLYSEISGKHPFHFIGGGETYEIVPSHPDYVFQQYTGEKDKNGKEIYEGDIIINHLSYEDSLGGQLEDSIGQVRWISTKDNMDYSGWEAWPADLPWGEDNNVEVIGNIFQNPELLEK